MAQPQSTGTVAGYFENHKDAQRALDQLRDAGFDSAQMGMAQRGSDTSDPGMGPTGQKSEGAWHKVKDFFSLKPAEPYADERAKGDFATREVTPDSTPSGGVRQSGRTLDQNPGSTAMSEDRSRYFSSRLNSNPDGAVVAVNAGSRNTEAEAILMRCGADLGQNTAGYNPNEAINE